ncbi:MAG: phosphatidylinositol kinase [Epsilonproteobacteria bacterium]|nr:phosphatidylinositol kinase [Campylobacterota bacterium]
MEKFTIFKIPFHKYESIEQLGTKRKFWFIDDTDDKLKLFKIGREGTGENWVEVVVSHICELLDIPHAKYEFAIWDGQLGTISKSFVPENGRLIHGNELLAKIDKNYPINEYKVRDYSLRTVSIIMKHASASLPLGYSNEMCSSCFDVFISYIMLDCLISNGDRHHENWGFIVYESKVYLAPTYDHASGLGCRESDEIKTKRLQTKDQNYQVKSFVKRARTPFFNKDKMVTTLEAFELCANYDKTIALYWLNKLEVLDLENVRNIFVKIPSDLISLTSIEFAMKVLEENKMRLLEVKEALLND